MYRQVRTLRKILPEQAIGVFVGPTLPRALRITEVHLDVGSKCEPKVIGHLGSTIPGERLVQFLRELVSLLDQGVGVGSPEEGRISWLNSAPF